MKLLRQFATLFRKEKLDAEMAEEMRVHLEFQVEENVARGMSREEARHAAMREFGGVEQIKERCRDERWRGFAWIEQTSQDVRYAIRQLAKAKGFTTVVGLTLALGIGATTAIYSVVDAVILNPVPGPDSDRVVQVGQWIQLANKPPTNDAGASPPVAQAFEAERDLFEDLTWCDGVQFEKKGDDFSTTVFGAMVPPNFFAFLGSRPLLGRTFAADEATTFDRDRLPAKDTVIILSHAWWQSEFAGDRAVLGKSIELGGRRFAIVGVMPPHFQFPNAQFWVPGEPIRPRARSLGTLNARIIARLRPGITLSQAQAMADTVAQRLMRDYPAGDRHYGDWWRSRPAGLRLWVRPLGETMQGRTYTAGYDEIRRTLLGFLAAIGFVLLIACANVANLTLARTERRQHELAIRTALGAGRARLMRQLLTENVLLAVLGGLAGLVVTAWGMKLLTAFITMPRLRPIEVDGRVLGLALLMSAIAGIGVGLAPAWRAGRSRINQALAHGGAAAPTGARGNRYRSALVVIEVALAVVLLAGAGSMIQSVIRLLRVDPGFDPANLVSVKFHFSKLGWNEAERRNALMKQLHERVAGLPGVSAVGVFKDENTERKFAIEGRAEPVLLIGAHCGVEESDFFRAARIPLLRGRCFTRGDVGENAGTVIVSETLAETCWPGENPLGKKIQALERKGNPTYEVIGVVGDARINRFDETLRPMLYRPYQEAGMAGAVETLVVRTQRDPAGIIPAIRRELKAVAPETWMPWINSVRQQLYDATQAQRTYRNYLVVFAGVGLLLSALGIYGVLAYSVARRTREIGIRIAIGATRRDVLALVVGEGARLIALGLAIGLLAAFWLTRFLQNQLVEVEAHDPAVLSGVVAALSLVALSACWLPARRATKVDPMVALRAE